MKQSTVIKRILYIALSLIIIALIALTVFYALKKDISTAEDLPLAQQPGGVTTSMIIDAVKEPGAIEALVSYEEQPALSGEYAMMLTKDGVVYTVTVPLEDVAVYSHVDTAAMIDKNRLLDDSKQFFANELLPEVDRNETSATYQNETLTCKLTIAEDTLQSATYACVTTAEASAAFMKQTGAEQS